MIVKLQNIIIMALFGAMMIFCTACTTDTNPPLNVICFNIRNGAKDDGENNWEARREAVVAMLEEQQPDVWGVQEALDFQRDYILEKMPDYRAVGVGRNDGTDEGEHVSIFWNTKFMEMVKSGNFWLSETPDIPSKGWDAKYPRLATWTLLKDLRNGKSFYVVNTHMDHKGKQARLESLKLICDRIDAMNQEKYPMIVMGDFNLEPQDSTVQYFNSRMNNARETASVSDSTPSSHEWGVVERMHIIDYIYYSGFSKCEEFKTLTGPWAGRSMISDHYPIKAKLAL